MPAIATFSDSAEPASGIVALAAQAATTSSGSPSRSEPSTKRESDGSSSESGGASCATSATAPCGAKSAIGTRKIEPAEARSAFGPVGSAQPAREREVGAERVARPGQRADVAGIADAPQLEPERRQLRAPAAPLRKTPITRGACPSVETSASRCDETCSARSVKLRRRAASTSAKSSSQPPSSAAATRSSPSATNSPSLSRCRRDSELADELQLRVVARSDHMRHRIQLPWKSQREQKAPLAAGPERDLELVAVVPVLLELLDGPRRDPAERALAAGLLQQRAQLGALLAADVAGRRGLEDDRQRLLVTLGEHAGSSSHVVAAHERRRLVAAGSRSRGRSRCAPLDAAGPDERAQQPRAVLGRDVDRD